MKNLILLISVLVILISSEKSWTQDADLTIHFDQKLREWDGFGVNYVEVRHTRNYSEFPQDYGGFKYLDEAERQQVINLVFGEDGLKPGILKMFADPFMEIENDNDDPYHLDLSKFDHRTTTRWMRYFATEGQRKMKSWGGNLVVLAGIYGPPGFTTKQKVMRGRDLAVDMKLEIAEFIIAWAKYLREQEGLNVQYISPHNEGEGQQRWTEDGYDHRELYHHDYNMWWPYHQIVDWLTYADDVLYANDMMDIKISNGEATTWKRLFDFSNWDKVDANTAKAIANNSEAMNNLGLITSHGFRNEYMSKGIDILRQKNPGLHAWTTSYTWGKMNFEIIEDARNHIYQTKCNGLIPWATLHHDHESDKLSPPMRFRRSSNANSPIKTNNGEVEITKGYYLYKQISRAGQPGMSVSNVSTSNPQIQAIAFAQDHTINPDAFVIINKNDHPETVEIKVNGSNYQQFQIYCTSDGAETNYDEHDYHLEYVLNEKKVNSAQKIELDKGRWILEVAVSWDELGGPSIKPGMKIGFDVTLADSDADGDREGVMGWHTRYNVVDQDPSAFGVVVLKESQNLKVPSFEKVKYNPEIDGEVDKMWSSIPENTISSNISKEPSIDKAYWKAVWNENGIYLLIERLENKLHVNSQEPSWKNDNVNLYFNMDYEQDQFSDYNYEDFGIRRLKNSKLIMEFPERSVTTFFGIK